jgi:tRNA pseudouridine38-40 synthase
MARNFRLTLAYDGSEFHGWQVQPGKATVQGTLQEALQRLLPAALRHPAPLPQGSGRTDAGVHALAQVASVELDSPIPAANLRTALNDILPPAIRVLEVAEAPPEFHARRSAKGKTYRYRIFRGDVCPPFLARYVTHYPYPLDEGAMAAAARAVVGEHDFTSFAAVDAEKGKDEGASNVRTISDSRFVRDGDELVYTVSGSGFLHHMVRNLMGTFLLVGKGTLQADDIARILAAKDRSAAGATAPANGLYLVKVEY